MKFPWTKRNDDAIAETEKAKTDYEWAVQQRTTVSDLVDRVVQHGEQNQIIENLINGVTRGGRRA